MEFPEPVLENNANARAYLRRQLECEYERSYGLPTRDFLDGVVAAWMDDANNSRHRFDAIEAELPHAKRILDLASGCGTMVYYGLLHGYDMHGVDPEDWKHQFNKIKAAELGYAPEWPARMRYGVGERLPWPDDYFDCVSTYQTLEHVQDVERVVREMLRVTRPGGGIHMMCPDYRGTFEGHYRLPWLPMLPRPLARAYLALLGRPRAGLDAIQYVTAPRLIAMIRRAARDAGIDVSIVDHNRLRDSQRRRWRGALAASHALRFLRRFLKTLFRVELGVDFFVHVMGKDNR